MITIQSVVENVFEKFSLASLPPSEKSDSFYHSEQYNHFLNDAERYGITTNPNEIAKELTSNVPLLGILMYRFSRYFYLRNQEDEAKKFAFVGRIVSGMDLYYSANIGAGLKINHGNGTIIGRGVEIGANCTIYQGVTIGDANPLVKDKYNRPKLGNNCVLFANCSILGEANLEDNQVVGIGEIIRVTA